MPTPILENGPAALLVIGEPERRKIATLRAAAEASPIALADVLMRQRRAFEGRPLADPAERTITLRFEFLASYAIEEHPDGTWRRLSITSRRGRIEASQMAMLMRDFGFGSPLAAAVAWKGTSSAKQSTWSVSELIEARAEPKIVPLFAAPGVEEPADDPIPEPVEDEETADEC